MAAGKKVQGVLMWLDFLILTLHQNWIHTLRRVHYGHSFRRITQITIGISFLFHVEIQAIDVQ